MPLEAVGGLGERGPDWAATQPRTQEVCTRCDFLLSLPWNSYYVFSERPTLSFCTEPVLLGRRWTQKDTSRADADVYSDSRVLPSAQRLACSCGECGLLRHMPSHTAAHVLESRGHMCSGFCYLSKGSTEGSHLPPLGRLCSLRREQRGRERVPGFQKSPSTSKDRKQKTTAKNLSLCPSVWCLTPETPVTPAMGQG